MIDRHVSLNVYICWFRPKFILYSRGLMIVTDQMGKIMEKNINFRLNTVFLESILVDFDIFTRDVACACPFTIT